MSDFNKLAKIAINKSLCKEYKNQETNERVVYLNNNQEFQIQLFNPYTYTIGATISFNGAYSATKLVIRPGERIWLDRFLDNQSKLLFSTYEVNGNSQEVQNAIRDNGKLVINFYKKKIENNYQQPYIISYNNPLTYNYGSETGKPNDVTCVYNSQNLFNTAGIKLGGCTTSAASTYDIGGFQTAASTNKPIKETGTIERGSHSNQNLSQVNIDFEYFSFHTETFKLLPLSQKQVHSNDLKKLYCHECGRKINAKYKFCPFCGSRI